MNQKSLSSVLLDLAKESIQVRLFSTVVMNKSQLLQLYPALNEPRATFVTLNLNGRLRGCIGSLTAHRTLYDDIVSNATAAAFHDPRFAPLTYDEFQNVNIEISLLTTPQPLEYNDKADLKSKINCGTDGVIIKLGIHQATFLPQVWEQLPTFELFFEHLCNKANMEESCLEHHPDIFIYHVEKIK